MKDSLRRGVDKELKAYFPVREISTQEDRFAKEGKGQLGGTKKPRDGTGVESQFTAFE